MNDQPDMDDFAAPPKDPLAGPGEPRIPVTQQYIDTLMYALETHGPCRSRSLDVRAVLEFLAESKLPRPVDWCFHYNGPVEFRWHNGNSEHLGTSTRSISLFVMSDGLKINGRVKHGYDDKGRIDIEALDYDGAMRVLPVFIDLVLRKGA